MSSPTISTSWLEEHELEAERRRAEEDSRQSRLEDYQKLIDRLWTAGDEPQGAH